MPVVHVGSYEDHWRSLSFLQGGLTSSIQPAGFPDSRDVWSCLWPVSTWFVAGAMQANWQHALPAVTWLCCSSILDHCWSKTLSLLFYPMHKFHNRPGDIGDRDVSQKLAVFRLCQKGHYGHLIGSLPRILAAQHRASTSPSGGS